ncbi:outer membrane protein assembly factor BamE [uncultured Psychrobacter sp.]|uniref:outer membrane protein assembly factor BamE n=1 Tax=uncultured Psychrobacter sp. TaxID=259303 RepID=UPI00262436E6|nr:outer membrane protein assembly factor BamE [uncultured Psychrobacter sp.]
MNLSTYGHGLLAATLLLAVTGCTWHVSPGAQHGTVHPDDLVFPDQSKAWQREGRIVEQNDVAKIKVGTTKNEIYKLIGTPHFQEGFNAREWDYILKFYDANQNVETCRYKIIFDDSYEGILRKDEFYATETYWQPASCAKYSQFTQ